MWRGLTTEACTVH